MTVDDKIDQRPGEGVPATGDTEDVRDVATTEGVETGPAETAFSEKVGFVRRGIPRWLRKLKLVPVAISLLLVISAVLAAWLYFWQFRPDQQVDAGAARAAVATASEGTAALLSYSPDTVEQDVARAKSRLTGDFLSYYDAYTRQVVAPTAKQKSVKTTATVTAAALAEMHPGSAVVLLFVNQSTTSKDKPDPSTSLSSVRVTMTKVGDKWLISKFDPV